MNTLPSLDAYTRQEVLREGPFITPVWLTEVPARELDLPADAPHRSVVLGNGLCADARTWEQFARWSIGFASQTAGERWTVVRYNDPDHSYQQDHYTNTLAEIVSLAADRSESAITQIGHSRATKSAVAVHEEFDQLVSSTQCVAPVGGFLPERRNSGRNLPKAVVRGLDVVLQANRLLRESGISLYSLTCDYGEARRSAAMLAALMSKGAGRATRGLTTFLEEISEIITEPATSMEDNGSFEVIPLRTVAHSLARLHDQGKKVGVTLCDWDQVCPSRHFQAKLTAAQYKGPVQRLPTAHMGPLISRRMAEQAVAEVIRIAPASNV